MTYVSLSEERFRELEELMGEYYAETNRSDIKRIDGKLYRSISRTWDLCVLGVSDPSGTVRDAVGAMVYQYFVIWDIYHHFPDGCHSCKAYHQKEMET